MAGKRLLDIAALFNASRGVAQKHIALRRRHLDVYNKTSTVAKGVRNQTDRVIETARAASFLASRLNESAPAWASESADSQPPVGRSSGESISSSDAVQDKPTKPKQKGSLEPDYPYKKSQSNSVVDPKPWEDVKTQKDNTDRLPLPEGRASSIPISTSRPLSAVTATRIKPQSELQIPSKTADGLGDSVADPLEDGHVKDSFDRTSGHTSATISSLPKVKIPKHQSRNQEGDLESQINSDSYHNSAESQKTEHLYSVEPVHQQDKVSEGINIDLFYSPRVARLLGGKTQGAKQGDLKLRSVKHTPLNDPHPAKDKDQDTSNVRISSEDLPSTTEASLERRKNTSKGYEIEEDVEKLAEDIAEESTNEPVKAGLHPKLQSISYGLRESKVPSSRLGRLWNYGGLAVGMFGGAVSESLRRVGGSGGEGSFMLSAGNMNRLVAKLSRMRGAALKLGQMMSFQDSKMLPAAIHEVLQRVQDRADYMPASQRNKVLASNLGPDWKELFSSFEEKPLAAASIGQVHRATLKSNGARVAVKVQYPGVADSIDSDLNNLALLLTASRLLPKGLFLDKTIANARTELAWECDYIREAECGRRFEELLVDERDIFVVPKVYPEASGKQVLTMEFMDGVGVTRVESFTQEQKDWIGTQILRLCLREITEFRFMQTDPNWTNFLYNSMTKKLELLDFGASREYPDEFITKYAKLLAAASKSDKEAVRALSIDLGYLTGHESKAMLDAHIASVLTLAEPFLNSSPEVYDFKDQTITDRVRALIPVMIRERLSPPPEETYSLHRKLSGAFLLCARLESRVRCRELFENSMIKASLL